MSDELQKEIDRLTAENKKLAGDVTSLTDELKDVRHEARDRRHEVKALTTQLETTVKERDEFRVKAEADPEGLRKQLGDLTGKLRGMTHRQAFERIAKTLRVSDPTRQADLYALSGYTPESDDVDEAGITEAIGAALKGRPWFLDAEEKPAPGGATTAPGGANGASTTQPGEKPGPGADRGQSLTQQSSQAAQRTPGRL